MITVSTPLWLQRSMLRNLHQAAKSKVNKARASRAKEILDAIDHRSNTSGLPEENSSANLSMSKPVNTEYPTSAVQQPNTKKGSWPKGIFNRCINSIYGFLKQSPFLRLANNR